MAISNDMILGSIRQTPDSGRTNLASLVAHNQQRIANGQEPLSLAEYNQLQSRMGSQSAGREEVQTTDDPTGWQVPTGGGEGGSAAINEAAIDATRQGLGALDTELSVGKQNIRGGFDNIMGTYDRERDRYQQDYDDQSLQNRQNLTTQQQNALMAGAEGHRGLRGTLASLGALGGDGIDMASRAATRAVEQDVGGARDTYGTNARELDTAWGRFRDEDEDRRAEAQAARDNQMRQLRGNIAGQRQGLYRDLADLYNEGEDTASAERYIGRAGDLNEQIAQSGRQDAPELRERSAAFTPGSLESYLGGQQDLRVGVGSQGQGQGASPQLRGFRRPRGEEEEER